MKFRFSHWLLAVAASALVVPLAAAEPPKGAGLKYPETKKVEVVDTIHGEKIPDPYRWLEDDNAADTKAWVQAQNKVTFGYLESIPARQKIIDRLTKLWNYEKFGTPSRQGDKYIYSKNDGLQNQSVVYWLRSLDGEPRELIDPNTLSKDGTVALSGLSIDDAGKLMAYGLSDGGSDWQTYRVRDIESGKDLEDVIRWVKFSGASWTKDGKGFFYSRYDEPKEGELLSGSNYYQKLYYHKLGTPQSEDELVYHRPDQKDWGFGGSVTEDGKYLIISVWKGTERKNRVYYQDLSRKGADVVKLLDDFDAEYDFLGNDGTVFYFRTDLNAPRGRIIAIDTRNPGRDKWKELIAQAKETLEGASIVGDNLFANYLKDAATQVKVFDLSGKHVRDVDLPGIGSAGGFGGRRDHTETFYAFNSFTTPPCVYRYDLKTGKSTLFRKPTVDFNPDDYVTEQVFYSSKDGTQVPMFISYKKGLKRDGKNPSLLYGYGGFNISLTPRFSLSNVLWMDMGGVFAQPNLRGGGEYGKEWHEAGRLLNKQNVFDDFIAAAEWLISNQYTNSDKLAIYGGSNGGLLVGACMTQRPELFAAAMPAVGVLDMLRFHEFTIGHAWRSDYGDINDPSMFNVLKSYSPYHNLKPGTEYPATMITTGDHDDRVVPAHSFKFAARLQECHEGDAPVLIRIETRAGHGAGKPTKLQIEEAADRIAFLKKVMGIEDLKE